MPHFNRKARAYIKSLYREKSGFSLYSSFWVYNGNPNGEEEYIEYSEASEEIQKELRQIELSVYLADNYPDATPEERRYARAWSKSGESVWDNGSQFLEGDGRTPLDIIAEYQAWEEIMAHPEIYMPYDYDDAEAYEFIRSLEEDENPEA